MKRYLAVFTGSPSAWARWQTIPEATRRKRESEGMAEWKKWAVDNAASIVEFGGPLGKTKLVSNGGISDIRNQMGGFAIVQAESQEAAATLFIGHPHFTLLPGEGVEVMEILAVPEG